MTTYTIDTHATVLDLEQVGFNLKQAELVASLLARNDAQLATKADFGLLKADIKRLDDKVDKLDGRIDKLDDRVDKLDEKIDRLDDKVDKLGDRLDDKINRQGEMFKADLNKLGDDLTACIRAQGVNMRWTVGIVVAIAIAVMGLFTGL